MSSGQRSGVSLVRLDFWAPGAMRDWVDRQATKAGQHRSEFLRDLVDEERDRTEKRGEDLRRDMTRATALLIKARKFENETVRNYDEMAAWRRELDAFLADRPGDNPDERYDTPERVEHRAFIARLMRPAWPVGRGKGKAGIVTHRVAFRAKRKADK